MEKWVGLCAEGKGSGAAVEEYNLVLDNIAEKCLSPMFLS